MTASKSPGTISAQTTKAPFMSLKELRKVLGSDAKELNDEKLRELSLGLGKIALLMVNNPEIFNNLSTKTKGGQNEQK